MSMSSWLNDAHPFPSGENGSFNPTVDPSMAFMQTPTPASYDYNQLQNQQLQQRMHNGNAPNGSPVAPNSIYQTHTTIPSKRPRPREDNVVASPRQYPGGLPVSRSQTPQGSFPGYQSTLNGGAQYPGLGPYQQYPGNAGSSSQSPNLQHQGFNPQVANQRMHTISPSPFSPAVQNFGAQGSPHSEHGSRVNTPQSVGNTYPQGIHYGSGTGQPFTPPAVSTVSGASPSQYGQLPINHQQQQLIYEARMRQMQSANGPMPQRPQPQGNPPHPLGPPTNNMANYQAMAQIRAQHGPQAQQRNNGMDDLLRNISQFMQQRRMPFNASPIITGRQINSIQLFVGVVKLGGSRNMTAQARWPNVAQLLGFPQGHWVAAAQELQAYWDRNLGSYEMYWMQQQQQKHQVQQQQQRQRAMAESMKGPINAGVDGPVRADAFSPSKQMHEQAQNLMQPPPPIRPPYQTPVKPAPVSETDPRQAMQNGHMNLQQGRMQTRQSNTYNMSQNHAAQHSSISLSNKSQSLSPQSKRIGRPHRNDRTRPDLENPKIRDNPMTWMPRIQYIDGVYSPKIDDLDLSMHIGDRAHGRNSDDISAQPDVAVGTKTQIDWALHHGGLPVTDPKFVENIDALMKYKFTVPKIEELGEVDIRAVTLSLRSCIDGEVRLALDTITSLSVLPKPPSLDQCGDLVESLIECANDHVDLLAEHATEVSDAMSIKSYEELIRGCKMENETLQEIPAFGTTGHVLDRAADKVICITTILRNFSFSQDSHQSLADPMVLRMMINVVRHLGTRNMMLQSHRNGLDFSKDVVIFLSNLAYCLDLSSKEDAYYVAHFLVSFAPLPEPYSGDDQSITFASYSPSLNRYLPHAIDSMAKLLARDPNRFLFRSVFHADMSASPPFDLLTRAFGLAISPVPEVAAADFNIIVKKRAPFLAQGLLAADQLISMIPSTEHELARSWMISQDGFAQKLMRMTSLLALRIPAQPIPPVRPQQRHPEASAEQNDPDGFGMIASRGMMVLKKLAERVKDTGGSTSGLPWGVLPNKQSILSVLGAASMNPDLIRQFCLCSVLGN